MKAATRHDWQGLQPLHRDALTLPLSLRFRDEQMANIRQGFIPPAMEYKWFCYFEGETLHLYRSWTGSKAAEVLFVRDSEGWWLASRMRLSLDPDHFGWSLEEAKSIIESEIAFYAAGQVPADGFAQMLQTASQAGYFGSPSVVHELLFPFFHCLLCKGVAPHIEGIPARSVADVVEENKRVTRAISRQTGEVHGLEAWRTAEQLGKALIHYFELDEGWHAGEDLAFTLSEGLAAVGIQVSEVILAFIHAPSPTLDGLIQYLKVIQDFVVSVMMGTNSAYYPYLVLADFSWGRRNEFAAQGRAMSHARADEEDVE